MAGKATNASASVPPATDVLVRFAHCGGEVSPYHPTEYSVEEPETYWCAGCDKNHAPPRDSDTIYSGPCGHAVQFAATYCGICGACTKPA